MSKTSYILIFLLLICLGVFVYLQYFSQVEKKLPTLKQKEESDTSLAQGTLSLSPASQQLRSGQTSTVGVFIDISNATPTVLQFEIAYDPTIITPLQITPGNYFVNPVVVLNTINPGNGRISYAITCPIDSDKNAHCGNNTSERVAQITFMVNQFALGSETSLNLMPKTQLETKESNEVILKTTNAKIFIQGAAATVASPSAAINQ